MEFKVVQLHLNSIFVDHLVKYLPIGIKTKADYTQVVPTQVLFLYLKARIGIHKDSKTEDDAEVVEIVLAIKISKVVEIVLAKKIAKIIVTIAIANNLNIYGIDRGETTDDVAVLHQEQDYNCINYNPHSYIIIALSIEIPSPPDSSAFSTTKYTSSTQ
ncbi:hypothetical protein ACTFIU_000100 [Dictyostelium citrinum]